MIRRNAMRRSGFVAAMAAIIGLSAALAGPATAARAEDEKPSICVLPFKSPGVVDAGVTRLATRVEGALVRMGRFTVVERVKLESLLSEQELSSSGALDPNRAVRAGKMIGARYLLSATMSIWRLEVDRKSVPNTTHYLNNPRGTMVADVKIVDAETGEIILAEKVDVRKRFKARGRGPEDRLSGDEEDEFYIECVRKIVGKVMGQLAPIRAIASSEREVKINRGSSGGIKSGQVFDVYAQGSAVKDPRTGESLGRDRIKVAIVKIARVAERFAEADVQSGYAAMIPKENICTLTDGKPVSDLANIGPIVEILMPEDGSTASARKIRVQVRTLGGAGKLDVTVNDRKAPGANGTYLVDVDLGQGWTPIVAKATDTRGKTGEAKIRVLFDETPPGIAFLEPAGDSAVRGHRVRTVVQVTDDGGVSKVEVLGVEATELGGGRYAVDVILAEGVNRIVAVATDLSGNRAEQSISVARDSTAPSVTIASPGDGTRHAGEVIVKTKVPGDDIATVTIGGQPATRGADGAWEATVKLPGGEHWIVAEATDNAGNVGAARIRVAIDDKGPSLEVATRVKVGGKADPKTVVTVNGTAVKVGADGAFEVEIDLPPDKLVRVVATDAYGNTTERVIDYGR